MLSLVHMSGDPDLIRGGLNRGGLKPAGQGYMSEEDKSAVRKLALEVIADYRDAAVLNRSRSARSCCWR